MTRRRRGRRYRCAVCRRQDRRLVALVGLQVFRRQGGELRLVVSTRRYPARVCAWPCAAPFAHLHRDLAAPPAAPAPALQVQELPR